MAVIQTTRFGQVKVSDSSILSMSEGMLGFEGCKRYVLLEDKPDTPLKWLQAVDDPRIAFIVVNPQDFVPGYDFNLSDDDAEALGLESAEQAVVLTTVSVDADRDEITTNLLGPVVINSVTLAGKQVVLQDDRYGTRHLIGKNTDARVDAHLAMAEAA
jgi:flagellar assembly factor FliW